MAAATGSTFFAAGFDANNESRNDGELDLVAAGLAAAAFLAAGFGGADFLAATGAAGFETCFGLDSKRESRNDGGLDLDSTLALFLATGFGGAAFFATGAAGLGFDSKIESRNDGDAAFGHRREDNIQE